MNWRLNYPSFVPCLTNKDSGEVMELSFLVKSEDEAIRLSTTLGELCGTPPRSIGRSEEISREELSDYVRLRKKLTSQHPMWAFSARIVESRNLHGSLLQLLEIGPVICLLFLLAVSAIILARQPFTALQLLTIAAGYALYFPLMLYLSSRFSFTVALIIAVVVPGALLVNYARLLLGTKIGFIGGIVFLLLYQVFPTLAAFSGWNRGMVLLCLGVVTFGVLINLQNQALKRKLAAAIALLCLLQPAFAADVQVIVPGQLVTKSSDAEKQPTQPVLSFEPAEYRIVHEPAFFRVEVKAPFQVLRDGEALVPLFTQALHLQAQKIESPAPDLARFGLVKNRLALLALRPGSGVLHFTYRVAIENHEGRKRAQFPMLIGPSG